jgi:tight adherence protein B
MTLTWLALAAALLLAPVPSAAVGRTRALAGAGPAGRVTWVRSVPVTALPSGIGVAGALSALLLAVVRGVPLGLAAAVTAATLAWLAGAASTARRRERDRARLLAAVRLLIAELESGARPEAALTAAGEACRIPAGPAGPSDRLGSAFAAAAQAAARGSEVSVVLLRDGELAPLGHAWAVAERAGAPLAETLNGVAGDLAARDETARAVASAVAGPRASAGLLAVLPLLGVGLGAAMGARPWAFLTGSGAGQLVCLLGTLLDAAGVVWTQLLVRNAIRPAGVPQPEPDR